MSKVIKTKNNKKIVLFNPAEKGKHYARNLKRGCRKDTGETFTKEQKSFMSGYLTARSDSAKAYCHNEGIKSKAKPRTRKSKRVA